MWPHSARSILHRRSWRWRSSAPSRRPSTFVLFFTILVGLLDRLADDASFIPRARGRRRARPVASLTLPFGIGNVPRAPQRLWDALRPGMSVGYEWSPRAVARC